MIVWPCDKEHCMCIECFIDYGNIKLNDRAFIQKGSDIGYTLPCPGKSPAISKVQNNSQKYDLVNQDIQIISITLHL